MGGKLIFRSVGIVPVSTALIALANRPYAFRPRKSSPLSE
jgi:hypothetical protein